MRAAVAIGQQPTWQDALAEGDVPDADCSEREIIDLAFLFASSDYAEEFPELVAGARRATRTRLLIGCSSQGVIGTGREVEGQSALALLTFSLPGAVLRPVRLTQSTLEQCRGSEAWRGMTRVAPDDVTGWFMFADPFTLDAEGLLVAWSDAYPGTPIVGGIASGDLRRRRTHVFLNDSVRSRRCRHGPRGNIRMRTIVSQGCTPIGEPWTITGATGNVIETIAQRPAYQVLLETV